MQGVVTLGAWHGIWRALGATEGSERLFHELIACYSEPHRHYHTLQHLRECLAQFDAARGEARHPAEIDLALWFHDIVYDVRRDDNELRSANWARQAMLDAGLADRAAERVHALVMATRHLATPEDADARLLVDADLAILGADTPRFDESNAQIRSEYAHVEEPLFRRGRRQVLTGFLNRAAIYSTQRFWLAYEESARANLRRTLAGLGPS